MSDMKFSRKLSVHIEIDIPATAVSVAHKDPNPVVHDRNAGAQREESTL